MVSLSDRLATECKGPGHAYGGAEHAVSSSSAMLFAHFDKQCEGDHTPCTQRGVEYVLMLSVCIHPVRMCSTQDEPAFCGLTTLAMVLNTLRWGPRLSHMHTSQLHEGPSPEMHALSDTHKLSHCFTVFSNSVCITAYASCNCMDVP